MNRFAIFRFAVFALALGSAAVTMAATPHRYLLQGTNAGYRFSNCGDFTDGQAVDYRVKDDKIYIRRDGDKDSKCSIEATMMGNNSSDTAAGKDDKGGYAKGTVTLYTDKPITYQKGTILGFGTRRDTFVGGGGGGGNGTPGTPVSSWTRHAKVYELRGADFVYEVDYCGAFQSGNFSPGQEVEFRVGSGRLYIRHDGNKEYSCQLEGQRLPDDAKPAAPAAPAPAAAPSAQR
ncbi:MAG TPA: hypothetical protein VKR59_07430 [Terriglobales bacterium]|nr:hypothetical protein [Terriglobales bacterium]